MPVVPFPSLPDDARVWVFASDHALTDARAARLLTAVDQYLDGWKAHGLPLRAAADWREDHFLAIGVDQSDAHASGCSIDGLFRTLRSLETVLGASLVGGGRVFYRDASGDVRSVSRDEFAELAASGAVTADTRVFDATVATAGDWRRNFEKDARRSWHAELLEAVA